MKTGGCRFETKPLKRGTTDSNLCGKPTEASDTSVGLHLCFSFLHLEIALAALNSCASHRLCLQRESEPPFPLRLGSVSRGPARARVSLGVMLYSHGLVGSTLKGQWVPTCGFAGMLAEKSQVGRCQDALCSWAFAARLQPKQVWLESSRREANTVLLALRYSEEDSDTDSKSF